MRLVLCLQISGAGAPRDGRAGKRIAGFYERTSDQIELEPKWYRGMSWVVFVLVSGSDPHGMVPARRPRPRHEIKGGIWLHPQKLFLPTNPLL